MNGRRTNRFLLSAVIIGLVLPWAISAAPGDGSAGPTSAPATAPDRAPASRRSLTREERLHQLEAQQAQLALDQARAEMQKAKVELDEVRKLFEEKLYTLEELSVATRQHELAVLKYEQAKIALEKKRLEFLKDATLVTVLDAKKYRGEEGEVLASVKLRNDSDISKARIAMQGGERLSDEQLASLLKVDNIIVALLGEVQLVSGVGPDKRYYSTGKAIIGDPFQQIVRELRHGQEVDLTFRLLKKDVENVTVSLEFLGTKKDYDVFLKKESRQDLPIISSGQYTQIGQLGSKITYDLDLERLAKAEQGFSLVVLNLPQEIKPSMLDGASKANITEIRFTEELSKQRLYLELSIPEKLSPKLVDSNISFYFLATRRSELRKIEQVKQKFQGKSIPPEEIAKLNATKVELAVIPRGVGKLEILVPNLFKEVRRGEPVSIKFNVLNSGTLALRRVTPKLDLPLEWEGEVEPVEVEVIQGGEKALFRANIRPPADVDVGEYSVKMEAEGHSGVEIVEATDRDLTVRIASAGSITGTVVLVVVLIVMVIGIAIASIKISRR